jgi:hypothetical protein
MPCFVNGQPVPDEFVREAEHFIGRDPRWQTIADETERAKRLRAAAQQAAADRVLIEQAAARDPRPIDADAARTGGCPAEGAMGIAERLRRHPPSAIGRALISRASPPRGDG